MIDGAIVCPTEDADTRTLAERLHQIIVVVDLAFCLLLLRLAHVIIVVEKVVGRRDPFEVPAHALLVGPYLLEWRARDRDKAHIALSEMNDKAVIAVGPERAVRTAGAPARIEHEMLNNELAAPLEQIGQRFATICPVEHVVLGDPDPRQLSPFRV